MAKKDCKKSKVAVGKDEVGSSNLPSSSRKLPKSHDFGSFCCGFVELNYTPGSGQEVDP